LTGSISYKALSILAMIGGRYYVLSSDRLGPYVAAFQAGDYRVLPQQPTTASLYAHRYAA